MSAHTTTPPFAGFAKPEANYFRLPNMWTDITARVSSLAELKLVEYVLKHTWGYREFDLVKKITTDEFMRGRKDKHGRRMDLGTGLSKQAVISGLALAVAHRLLEVEVDASDRARIKKAYKLHMVAEEGQKGESEGRSAPSSHAGVNNLDLGVKNVDSGVQTIDSGGQPTRQRTETDTQKERYINVQNVEKEIKLEPSGSSRSHGGSQTNAKSREEVAYFAQTLADKLGDRKSLSYYMLLCARFDPHQLLQKAAEIMGDGGARNPGAVFAAWAKTLTQSEGSLQQRQASQSGTTEAYVARVTMESS